MHRLRLALLGLALLMAAALVVRPWLVAPRPSPPQAVIAPIERPAAPSAPTPVAPEAPAIPQARDALTAALDAAPDYRRFFERLREAFPADHARAAKLAGEAAKDFNIDAAVSDSVRALRQARGVLAAKATAEPLSRVFDLQLAALKALEGRDARACVDFLYGGASEGLMTFSAANRGLVADLALAGLEAIVDGGGAKIDRPPPGEEDFAALEKALAAKGLEKAEIEALLDGRTPEPPLDDARMCKSGQIYLETLRELPEDIRLRIYALAVELMARS